MTTLSYKEYQGAVSFEDGMLVVEILHIDDSISTTCDSANEAQVVFEGLVDDYVETCALVGKEPNKPFKGTFNVRIGSLLHKAAVFAAAEANESLNSWIGKAVQQRVDRDGMMKALKEYALQRAMINPDALLTENVNRVWTYAPETRIPVAAKSYDSVILSVHERGLLGLPIVPDLEKSWLFRTGDAAFTQ